MNSRRHHQPGRVDGAGGGLPVLIAHVQVSIPHADSAIGARGAGPIDQRAPTDQQLDEPRQRRTLPWADAKSRDYTCVEYNGADRAFPGVMASANPELACAGADRRRPARLYS